MSDRYTFWVVLDYDGELAMPYVSYLKSEAIEKFLKYRQELDSVKRQNWKHFRKRGFKCHRVVRDDKPIRQLVR